MFKGEKERKTKSESGTQSPIKMTEINCIPYMQPCIICNMNTNTDLKTIIQDVVINQNSETILDVERV